MVVYPIEVNMFAKDNGCEFNGDQSLDYSYRLNREMPGPEDNGSIKRSGPVKALVINTCPLRDKGDVAALLDPFLEGMKGAGAEVELHYARDLMIFPCCGNLNCTIRTPGKCMAYDDMIWLRQKIGEADILVLASPLYFDGVVGLEGATRSLKALLGRLAPGQRYSTDMPYEHAIHTTKEPVNLRKVVFVSGCGFWEIDDLYPVLTHIKSLCHNTFPEFAGNIGDGHGVILNGAIRSGDSFEDIMASARSAGRRLASGDEGASLEPVTREMYDQILKD